MSGARVFFDAIARRYDRVYALSGAASRERMARVLALLEGRRRVLSLGIGTGRELPMLLDAGHDVEGIDVSAQMIAICNRRSRTVPIVCGDFYARLPYGDGTFDAVIALHGTLAHPPSNEALGHLAREIARVAGFLVAEVPAAEGLAAAGLAAADDEDVAIAMTTQGRFTHHDKVAGVSIDGVALSAEGWREALAPLSIDVEPLGGVEHRLVGRATPTR